MEESSHAARGLSPERSPACPQPIPIVRTEGMRRGPAGARARSQGRRIILTVKTLKTALRPKRSFQANLAPSSSPARSAASRFHPRLWRCSCGVKVDVTTHGFRSSFRDWCGEETSFPREIAEAALAHVVGDETERAYRRGTALEKRRRLMLAWANYCEPKFDNIVPLKLKAIG